MKRILLALLLPATLMVMSFSGAQTPDANQEQRLLALNKEVQTQQAQMAENQKKIETKLAEIGETDRVARSFAARPHGGRILPSPYCCPLFPLRRFASLQLIMHPHPSSARPTRVRSH